VGQLYSVVVRVFRCAHTYYTNDAIQNKTMGCFGGNEFPVKPIHLTNFNLRSYELVFKHVIYK